MESAVVDPDQLAEKNPSKNISKTILDFKKFCIPLDIDIQLWVEIAKDHSIRHHQYSFLFRRKDSHSTRLTNHLAKEHDVLCYFPAPRKFEIIRIIHSIRANLWLPLVAAIFSLHQTAELWARSYHLNYFLQVTTDLPTANFDGFCLAYVSLIENSSNDVYWFVAAVVVEQQKHFLVIIVRESIVVIVIDYVQ